MSIAKTVRKGILKLKNSKSSTKELKRFKDIYLTVYSFARKKGQSHKKAMRYCWNVYSEQAPDREKMIIRKALKDSTMLSRNKLREMILNEMYRVAEGDVVQMSDYAPAEEEPEAETPSPFAEFLSNIHTEMMDFMDENFESMTPEEGNFLDELLDSIEDVLGIDEEEGIEVPPDDEEEEDEGYGLDDED